MNQEDFWIALIEKLEEIKIRLINIDESLKVLGERVADAGFS